MNVTVRRLRPGDEAVVERLATRTPQIELLADPRTIFLVAFDDDGNPLGFVFGYDLPRRHGDPSIFFVYEIEVDAACRRQGIGKRLLHELAQIARSRGIREGFVLTDDDNAAANKLYAAAGGEKRDVVQWEFPYAGD